MRSWVVLLTSAFILSGCLATGSDGLEAPEDGVLIPTHEAHDHRDPEQHRLAIGAELLDFDNLQRFGASDSLVVGAHAMDVHHERNLLVVAVFGNHDDEPSAQNGFHLFDISNPGTLNHLAFYSVPDPVRGDRTIAFAPDGQTVFLGYEDGPRPGVAAVDVSDPTNPEEVAFFADEPLNYGPHTVSTGIINGQTHVFLLSLGVTVLTYEDETFTLVSKFVTADELAIIDTTRHLLPGDVEGPGYAQTYALRSIYGHDMTFYEDPETGKSLLLVAYGYDGFKLVDVSQPQLPLVIGRFLPPADTEHKHYTHTAVAERQADGRFLIVVGSETFELENQGIPSPLWVLDATDAVAAGQPYTRITEFETWTNPDDAPSGHLGLSLHFVRLQDGVLYVSHYHGGIWVLDVREGLNPTFMAAILPIPENPIVSHEVCCIGFDLGGSPMVFDVAVDRNGIFYGADITQGVSAMRLR